MSISAISSAYPYSSIGTSKRKSSTDDPMAQAISMLQSSDPTLASKLQTISDSVDKLKKSGASDDDIKKTIDSGMKGLSDSEKSELQSAMPTPPSGGPGDVGGAKGPGGPGGPPPAGGPPPSRGTKESSSFDLSSYLDASSSTQNDAITGYLSTRSSATVA